MAREWVAVPCTIVLVVGSDLLVGVFAGGIVGLMVSLSRGSRTVVAQPGNNPEEYVLAFHGPLTFANFIGIRSKLDTIPTGKSVLLDFSMCSHVDHTVAHRLNEFEAKYVKRGGRVERVGTWNLIPTTDHPLASQVVTRPKEVQDALDPDAALAAAFVLVRTERCKRCLAMMPGGEKGHERTALSRALRDPLEHLVRSPLDRESGRSHPSRERRRSQGTRRWS